MNSNLIVFFMLNGIYAIKDLKADSFGQVFVSPNHSTATRMFSELAKDDKTYVGKYPADYALFALADINLETGVIYPRFGTAVDKQGSPVVEPFFIVCAESLLNLAEMPFVPFGPSPNSK